MANRQLDLTPWKRELDYRMYLDWREDYRAVDAFREWKRAISMTVEDAMRGVVKGAISIVVALIMLGIVVKVERPDKYVTWGTLWIQSPSGKCLKEFPTSQALRIMRKHGWTTAGLDVLIKAKAPPRIVSRLDAFRILLFGDKPTDE